MHLNNTQTNLNMYTQYTFEYIQIVDFVALYTAARAALLLHDLRQLLTQSIQ